MAPRMEELGPLEMRVVGLLRDGEARSVQDVQAALARAGHDLAYTTVMTVLTRLHDKGAVGREKEGRRYLYVLGKRAPAMTDGIVSRIQKALFPADRMRPIMTLLEDEALSDEDLRALRRKIDARLRGKS